jgi:GDP-L-fucose synthase
MWSLLEYEEKDSIILSVSEKDEVSIAQVAYLIAQEYNYEDHMVFDTSYSDGQYKKTADNGKLMSLYPSFEYTNIQTGIHHAVTWFNQNVSSCRK